MNRMLTAAGLAAGLLALAAPPAAADHPDWRCSFRSVTQQDVTGPDTYEGVAEGYVVVPGDTPTIRCVILVNHAEAATTPTSAATPHAAVTAGRVTFVAGDTDIIQLCAVVTTVADGERLLCPNMLPPQLPPREVYDLLDLVLDEYAEHVDPVLCAALAEQRPGTGPVVIEEDGDVHVHGEWFYECPPYEWQRA